MRQSNYDPVGQEVNRFKRKKPRLLNRYRPPLAIRATFQVLAWALILFLLYKGFEAYMLGEQTKMQQKAQKTAQSNSQMARPKPPIAQSQGEAPAPAVAERRVERRTPTDCADLQTAFEHWQKIGSAKPSAWVYQRQQETISKQNALKCPGTNRNMPLAAVEETARERLVMAPGEVKRCEVDGRTFYSNTTCPAATRKEVVVQVETGTGIAPPPPPPRPPTAGSTAEPRGQVPEQGRPIYTGPSESDQKERVCAAWNKRVEWLDSMARHNSTQTIRDERQRARDKQFALGC